MTSHWRRRGDPVPFEQASVQPEAGARTGLDGEDATDTCTACFGSSDPREPERETCPHGEQAQTHLACDVRHGLGAVSFSHQRQGVEAEGREGREPTQYTDDDERAGIESPRQVLSRQQSTNETNKERARDI